MRWESGSTGVSTRRWTRRWPGSPESRDWKQRSTSLRLSSRISRPGRLLDLEPGFAHEQMAQALPMMTDGLMVVLQQCAREDGFETAVAPRDLAGAIARTALSHYMFPDPDRAAARRADPRRRRPAGPQGESPDEGSECRRPGVLAARARSRARGAAARLPGRAAARGRVLGGRRSRGDRRDQQGPRDLQLGQGRPDRRSEADGDRDGVDSLRRPAAPRRDAAHRQPGLHGAQGRAARTDHRADRRRRARRDRAGSARSTPSTRSAHPCRSW